MSKKIKPTVFVPKPQMQMDFEIFYNQDINLSSVDLHEHDYYELYYFISGNIEFTLEEKTFPLKPHRLLFIPPHTLHNLKVINNASDYTRFVLWFSKDLLKQLSTTDTNFLKIFDGQINNPFKLSYDMRFEIHSSLQEILYLHQSNDLGDDALCYSAVIKLLVYLLRVTSYKNYNLGSSEYNNDELLLFIQNYVNNNIYEPIDIDTIADEVFLSRTHLERLFKEKMDLSIFEYIRKKKLHLAQQDLLKGYSSQSVSNRYSFGDYSSFYRAFKKEFQMSPSHYIASFSKEVRL